jgi:hypothetical protein
MHDSNTGLAIGGILLLVAVAIGLVVFAFWLWMLIHALMNPGIDGSEKVAWVLVVFFGSLLGALIYFFVAKPKARRR